jgi:hypothetical protein
VIPDSKKTLCACAAVIIGLSASAPAARAAVTVFDNLGLTGFIQAYAAFGDINGPVGEEAFRFTPAQTVKLTTLDLVLGVSLSGSGPGTATVQLRLDNNNTPGDLMESFTTSPVTSLTGELSTVASAKGTTLAAGRAYWITAAQGPDATLGGGWFMAASTSGGFAVTAKRTPPDDWAEVDRFHGYATKVSGVVEVPGDANEDGKINADDYALIDRGLRRHLTGWNNGDFNGDNTVSTADYLIIDAQLAKQVGLNPDFLASREVAFGPDYAAALVAAVPEPASLTLAAAGLLGLRRRRK